MTLLELYNVLLQVGIPVAHNETELTEYPYIVYQEFNTDYSTASGKAYMEKIKVNICHYTKAEFDPSLELLKEILMNNNMSFNIATSYDRDSKITINQLDVTIAIEFWRNGNG